MTRIEKTMFASQTINAPIEDVFDRISDHENFLSTLALSSTSVTNPGINEKNGLGAIRHVRAPGLSLEEEITAFDRPNSFQYLIINPSSLAKHEYAKVSLHTIANGTRIDWESRLSTKGTIVGRVTGTLIQNVFIKIFGKLLKNLAAEYDKKSP